MELTDVALDYRIWNSTRSAEDLARAVIRAATRGDFYFFPPGEDLRLWWLKRLMPVRTLKLVGKKGVRMAAQVVFTLRSLAVLEFSKRFRSAARRRSSASEGSAHGRVVALCRT